MNRIAAHSLRAWTVSWVLVPLAVAAQQPSREVYRCPGNPVLYTDTLSAKEAKEKGCRTLEGAPITIVQGARPRTGAPVPAKADGARSVEERVNSSEQRARDSDSRRILQEELKREEDRLAALQKEYNHGQPEPQG